MGSRVSPWLLGAMAQGGYRKLACAGGKMVGNRKLHF